MCPVLENSNAREMEFLEDGSTMIEFRLSFEVVE